MLAILQGLRRNIGRRWRTVGLAIAFACFLLQAPSSRAQDAVMPGASLPALQPHPLPETLAQWRSGDDYFDRIAQTQVGYLVWSEFPLKVYVSPEEPAWAEAVGRAVGEWNQYLPLQQVDAPEAADILVWRRSPPLRIHSGNARARSAETRYELYWGRSNPPILFHRCQISLRPSQTVAYIQAAARHELGHALGIWGHSPQLTDALYFSQVRNPPAISPRDVNTLKRIYQQPTRLGWSVGG